MERSELVLLVEDDIPLAEEDTRMVREMLQRVGRELHVEHVNVTGLPGERLVELVRRLAAEVASGSHRASMPSGGWVDFVATGTAAMNSRLYRAVAWLEAAAGSLARIDAGLRDAGNGHPGPAPSRATLDALPSDARRAIAGAREEIRGVLARSVRVLHALPWERHTMATEYLADVLHSAGDILGAELPPGFEISTRCDLPVPLTVEGPALLRLTRQLVRSIVRVAPVGADVSAQLSLVAARSGGDACVLLDADLPALDPIVFQDVVRGIGVGRLVPESGDPGAIRLKSARVAGARTLVCFEVRLASLVSAPGRGEADEDHARAAWTRALSRVDDAVRELRASDSTKLGVARLHGAVVRALRAWPRYASGQRGILEELEHAVPALAHRVARLRARLHRLGSAFHAHGISLEYLAHCMDHAAPADRAALTCQLDAFRAWLDGIERFDDEVRGLELDGYWTDVGGAD